MSRSYAVLQAKKVAYAFTIPQREALLEEIESFNSKLENVLIANDRISGLNCQTASTPSKPRVPKSLLQFWRHADCMFRLLSQAWTCHCKGLHCARLWLKQRIAATADMKIMLQFCHDTRRCMHIQLEDNPALIPTCHGSAASLRLPLRPIGQQFTVPSIMVQSTNTATKISGNASTVTVSRIDSRVSWAPGHQQQQQQQQQAIALPIKDLGASELCETIRASGDAVGVGEHYGGLTDPISDRHYTVSALESSYPTTRTVTLADIIDGKLSVTLTRIQRYSTAVTLASSLLQLESTSWARGWTAGDVHFAHDSTAAPGATLEHDKPFFLAHFGLTSATIEDRFKSLGALLLELCFGKPLDEHELWRQAGFAMAKTNPMMRHFVACEWSKAVEGEAGEQYANAVRFCLHQGPASLSDEKWRVDFAQAVVWPLQQCYESMQPSKRGV
jgi:hypothetical protein